ncbi:MAG: alanine--tRNA ligase [Rhodospirillaceae bacterium]|nr:alanine--tRNA ligase [Rhodospirillaceae bacterium]
MKLTSEVRSTFLEFFKGNGHEIVNSSPLVPRNDPTLMFTNAGMVPFKDLFTGKVTPPYTRAASAQKCVRAGGKHNDLDNVGYTTRHHTFFEMLGNFSFGGYFKEEAISLAWDLLIKEFGLPEEKLLVTVHSSDEEAAGLWTKIAGLRNDRIIQIDSNDNFWSMGETGPCGPCTEVFYDHGEHISGGPPGSENEDGDRFVEIWNLVFMQYEQVSAEERVVLPKPCVDTGMGLERMTAILQGTNDNYETDIMTKLQTSVASLSSTHSSGDFAISHRVIADHLRAVCFLIADGVLPSNDGRGYVLRRIMRRAMRHAHLMGWKKPLLSELVSVLAQEMGDQYPELERAKPLTRETLLMEENRFKSMLERGLKLLDDEMEHLDAGALLSGHVAFKLYDTYGFPIDLTEDALRDKGIKIDYESFNLAMAQQKADARKAWTGSGDSSTDKLWFEILESHGVSEFLGYDSVSAQGIASAIVVNGSLVDHAKQGAAVIIVANQTPFYAESGGQVGDRGYISTENGVYIKITDTKKKVDSLHLHIGEIERGHLYTNDELLFGIDLEHRASVQRNHSATHLLHSALRQVLGSHVTQKGSLVAHNRLRFDLSHPKPITVKELIEVESLINEQIRNNGRVSTKLMDSATAIDSGAMALFGEKYDNEVRVVSIGEKDHSWSVELCGGTHADQTGDIGFFVIIDETAVGSGVRRLEALTGLAAEEWVRSQKQILHSASQALKVSVHDVTERITSVLQEKKLLQEELSTLRKKIISGSERSNNIKPITKLVGKVPFYGSVLQDVPAKDLKGLADEFKNSLGTAVIALVSIFDNKASLVVSATSDLVDTVDSVALVRIGAAAVGGKGGGGRRDMAQAGGPAYQNADQAIVEIEKYLTSLCS